MAGLACHKGAGGRLISDVPLLLIIAIFHRFGAPSGAVPLCAAYSAYTLFAQMGKLTGVVRNFGHRT